MGALGPAYNDLPESMQKALRTASEAIQKWVVDVLEDGIKIDEFNFSESVEEKADSILATLTFFIDSKQNFQEEMLSKMPGIQS